MLWALVKLRAPPPKGPAVLAHGSPLLHRGLYRQICYTARTHKKHQLLRYEAGRPVECRLVGLSSVGLGSQVLDCFLFLLHAVSAPHPAFTCPSGRRLGLVVSSLPGSLCPCLPSSPSSLPFTPHQVMLHIVPGRHLIQMYLLSCNSLLSPNFGQMCT